MLEVLGDIVGEVLGVFDTLRWTPLRKKAVMESTRTNTLPCDFELVTALTETLELLIRRSGSFLVPTDNSEATVFYDYNGTLETLCQDLDLFVETVVRDFFCSEAAFLVALIYMDRLERWSPCLRVNHFNVRRLFVTSVMIACKVLDDEVCRNSYYAAVCGLELQELNKMEALVLKELQYKTHVEPEEYYAIAAA
eukprot:Plantae.Rhodophyta-Purpureofilum_apyrenoidigerum.ctg2000.p1 GENE.Plantae.Rhodophyta-Purpureofilum_apyrenoidigerum.ctg2000~~Plantae.Rhodophyta-Purpureofilum_apyrenoidigerum.ctg2000.p1  ORF type:complete len:195 (+),score=45.70 Plantae.Rhodophyta-Purpureofilum_apyrenoidigerum.ctg2000:259-843(+)